MSSGDPLAQELPLDYPDSRDEVSDCTFPDELDLRNKKQLLRWQYLEGGYRLPLYIPKIPHVDETEVVSAVMSDEISFLELASRLAGDTKQIQQEYVYAKQRCDLLRQEKDLLKWHIASNSKVLKLKQGELNEAEARSALLERRLKSITIDADRFEREKKSLSTDVLKAEQTLDALGKDYESVAEEMQEWLARRSDFVADTTLERRRAGLERKLRQRQWKKLNRACNADKKWHTRIDGVRNADSMIFEAYADATRRLAVEFDNAADITGPMREILLETREPDPFEGFVSAAQKVIGGESR